MKKLSNLMIDIETLGTGTDAAILAIAAVYFDPKTGELGDEFYTNVNLQSNLNGRRSVDASTMIWWMQQEEAARNEVFGLNHKAPSLTEALTMFKEFVEFESVKVWGNGSGFDITILETAFKLTKQSPPWKFWNIRDVRTAVELGKLLDFDPKKDMPFEGVKHNALDDSKHQAKYVSAIFSQIANASEF